MSRARHSLALFVLFSLSACGGDSPPVTTRADAAVVLAGDAGDGAMRDGGPSPGSDASGADSGALGRPDAQVPRDSGAATPDAARLEDAGRADASISDAGGSDGDASDASTVGEPMDAGGKPGDAAVGHERPDAGHDASVAPVPDAALAEPDAAALPPATFSDVYAILKRSCLICHDKYDGMALDMGTPALAYANLVNVAALGPLCGDEPDLYRVIPGNLDDSLLVTKLGLHPPCGVSMPAAGGKLSDDRIEIIRSWIRAGALDN
jgi:hypothetical protein